MTIVVGPELDGLALRLPGQDLGGRHVNRVERPDVHRKRASRAVDDGLVVGSGTLADWLDMLGVVGAAREFTWGPNNLAVCVERIRARRAGIAGRFTLPRAQEIAEQRLAQMDALLRQLQEDSFGIL